MDTPYTLTVDPSRHSGHRRVHWAALLFIAGFGLLLVFICYTYLLPALQAVRVATPEEKAKLQAHARLVLAVLLFMVALVMLFAGAVLAMRFSRSIFPRGSSGQASSPISAAAGRANHRIDLKPGKIAERGFFDHGEHGELEGGKERVCQLSLVPDS